MISPNTGNTSYALKIVPDFIADTLAELDSNLEAYVGKYVQVSDQGGQIFYVESIRGVPTRRDAYSNNYTLGGNADGSYTFVQLSPSSVWNIAHPLQKFPSVTIVDSAGTEVVGDIKYESDSQITATFATGFSGKAYLN